MSDKPLGSKIEFDTEKIYSIVELIDLALDSELLTVENAEKLRQLYQDIPQDHWLIKRLAFVQSNWREREARVRCIALILYEHAFSVQKDSLTLGGAITHGLYPKVLRNLLIDKIVGFTDFESFVDKLFELKKSSLLDFEELYRMFLKRFVNTYQVEIFRLRTIEQFKYALEPGLVYLYKVFAQLRLDDIMVESFMTEYRRVGTLLFISETDMFKSASEPGFKEALDILVSLRLNPDYQIFYS